MNENRNQLRVLIKNFTCFIINPLAFTICLEKSSRKANAYKDFELNISNAKSDLDTPELEETSMPIIEVPDIAEYSEKRKNLN